MANPMYRQIAEDLRERIESGRARARQPAAYRTGAPREFKASRNTVRDAIKWLTNLGLVATRPGQGTFVVEKIDPFITTLSGDPKTGFGGGEGTRYLVGSKQREQEADHQPDPGGDPGGRARHRREAGEARLAASSSADTKSATSTVPPGRCRRRSTRWSSWNAER